MAREASEAKRPRSGAGSHGRRSTGPERRARKQRARDARHALYRDLILEAAEATFAAQGVDGSRMEQIAERAGLSLGTVYAVFRGKSEIVDALHEARLRDVMQLTKQAARGLTAPLDQLLAGVRAWVEYFVAHPDYLRMYLDEGRSWGSASAVPARAGRATAWAEGIERQTRLFRRGIADGTFYEGDPELFARMMVAMQQVQIARWLERGRNPEPSALIEEVARQVRRSFCRPLDGEA